MNILLLTSFMINFIIRIECTRGRVQALGYQLTQSFFCFHMVLDVLSTMLHIRFFSSFSPWGVTLHLKLTFGSIFFVTLMVRKR